MNIHFPLKKAQKVQTALWLTVGLPLSFTLGWLYNEYVQTEYGEFPGGVVLIVTLLGTHWLSQKFIKMECPKKGCHETVERRHWIDGKKKSILVTYRIRYYCKKCGEVKREDYTEIPGGGS